MTRLATGFVLVVAACALGAQESPLDQAAKAALEKLASRMKDVRTLTASVTQSRSTDLLDKPIVSSGSMAYRRLPACLVFRLIQPRTAEVHLDQSSYQVYRPDEKRLERIDFEGQDVTSKLLMVFEPKTEVIGKSFTITGGASQGGLVEVHLDSSDLRFRKRMKSLVLTIREADGALSRIAYTDPEGDLVQFDLSGVVINPELPAETFDLKVPEGTRILRRTVTLDK